MTKNNLLQIRLSDQELADLDFVVANQVGLSTRNRSYFIVRMIAILKKNMDKSEKQDKQVHLQWEATQKKIDHDKRVNELSREENI